MKKAFALLLLIGVFSLCIGHEFWLQPQRFRYKSGEDVKVSFLVGENFAGEAWDMNRNRAELVEVISAYGKKNMTADVKSTRSNNLTFKTTGEGGYLVTLKSNAAFIELDAQKFNEYLEEDGLDDIAARRRKLNETDKASRENYTRYAKLLVQAGTREDEIYKRKVGFPVEIIPQSNPLKLKSGDYLECLILFNGQPAPHQMVKVWSILGNRAMLQNAYTENDGKVKFPISNPGPWMVSFVKMVPSQKEGVDYESMWASYVFGI